MTKNYISTRQLPKTQSSLTGWNKYFIVMKHSQPSSILTPYHPDIERAIEDAIEKLEIEQSAREAIENHKKWLTCTSDDIRREIKSE